LRIAKLEHQLAGLRRQRFGATSESLEQLDLALEETEIEVARAADPAAPEDAGEARRRPRRKPLPEQLPRTETVLTPGEACAGCGGSLKRLGEDVTEELDYIPGRFVVNRYVRPRLACSCCEAIVQAPLPPRPIERGRPGPGRLAHVLVSKYGDHLPLYRQSKIFERDGIELDRSTFADWVGKSTALLEPLAAAIGRHVVAGQAIFADDTPIKLQAPGTGRTKTARIWTYVRDERPPPRPAGRVPSRDRIEGLLAFDGRVPIHRPSGTSSRSTARPSTPPNIWPVIEAGSMPTAIRASTNSIARTRSARSPASPTSAASSSTSSKVRHRRSRRISRPLASTVLPRPRNLALAGA
jgi:transposase